MAMGSILKRHHLDYQIVQLLKSKCAEISKSVVKLLTCVSVIHAWIWMRVREKTIQLEGLKKIWSDNTGYKIVLFHKH